MSGQLRECNRCRITKPLEDFSVHKTRQDGRHPTCKRCRADKAKENYHDADLRKATVDRSRQHRRALKQIIIAAKDIPCADCGVKYHHYVMDFDHRDPSQKSFGIARAVTRNIRQSTLREEIAKCDVVCSNCHRARTWQDQYEGRYAQYDLEDEHVTADVSLHRVSPRAVLQFGAMSAPVDVHAVAERLGISVKTVHVWKTTRKLLPPPDGRGPDGEDVWEWSTILRWAGDTGRLRTADLEDAYRKLTRRDPIPARAGGPVSAEVKERLDG